MVHSKIASRRYVGIPSKRKRSVTDIVRSAVDVLICNSDDQPCDGKIIFGEPACIAQNFGTWGDDVTYRCPRYKC